MRSLAYGGNKPFFELAQEFQLDKEDMLTRHSNIAVKWYKKRHQARMDGEVFNVARPSLKQSKTKTWTEQYGLLKAQAAPVANSLLDDMKKDHAEFRAQFKEDYLQTHDKISGKLNHWKRQVEAKEYGKKFKSFFTRNKGDN